MAELAKLSLAAAPACPNCRERITNLDLDSMAPGDEHQCMACGHVLRIPGAVLERLIAQRDAELADAKPAGLLERILEFFARLFGR